MMVAARVGAWTPSGTPLPYDAKVEYIQSSGTQHIDTGYIARKTDSVNGKAYVFSGQSSYIAVAASWQSYSGELLCDYYFGSMTWRDSVNGGFTFIPNQLDTVVEFTGGHANSSSSYSQPSITVALFAQHENGNNYTHKGRVRIYEFFVIRDGEKIVDMIPVRFTNENGVSEGAMYDRVSGQLFRNAGTGAFIIGPDKVGTELAGGGYKCVRRSWRSASRRSRHFSRWEVAA